MPLPWPTSLVVKNGSNMRSCTSAAMPGPVSETDSSTISPSTFLRQLVHTSGTRPTMAHGHADLPARSHRVARVDGEIHQYLLELDRIEQHGWRVVVEVGLEGDSRG